MSKYKIFSGPYYLAIGLNTGKYGPEKLRIWTFFTQCLISQLNERSQGFFVSNVFTEICPGLFEIPLVIFATYKILFDDD